MISKAPRRPSRLWQGRSRGALLTVCLWLAGTMPLTAADTVTRAHFTDPTTRYAHGVLGDFVEYGGLEMRIEDASSQAPLRLQPIYEWTTHSIKLPPDRVFEDLEPRLADVDLDGTNEVIVVESSVHEGAQLAIYNARGEKVAATPHIGTRFRWLAPIGAADLDGDGHVEIAYIDRPHLAKTLRIWRFKDGALTEIAALPGLTNHKIGEDFISGGIRSCGSRSALVVASADWSRVKGVYFQDGWKTTDLGPLRGRSDLTDALNC
ncbi:VCBS repeat-containing protein [Ruegeria sp. R8_2]|nr:VCBS repeat-containing protein [Ruegeria sp. R8_1]MBO9416569.1 VCBS repeat-containing protein [Ruegeria sp. R8_2]